MMRIKRLIKRVAMIIAMAAVSVVMVGCGAAWATGETAQGDVKVEPDHEEQCATILKDYCSSAESDGEKTIKEMIKFVIGVVSIGIGVLATIGIIVCGYMIMTAKNNDAQVTKAKTRLVEIVIGVVVWALGAAVVLLLVPDEEAANYAREAGIIKMEIKE